MDWLITGVGRRARRERAIVAAADELAVAGLCGDPRYPSC